MYCPKCGQKVSQGEQFCSRCGIQLATITGYQANNQENGNAPFTGSLNQNTTVNAGVFEQALVDAYIGKNVDKLKNGSFSLNTCFLGVFYVLYRKMWLLGLIWYVLNMVISFAIPVYDMYIQIVLNLVISIQFKRIYVKHVQVAVTKIKTENQGKSEEELIALCHKKGGTALWAVILLLIFYLALLVIAGFLFHSKPSVDKKTDQSPFTQQKPSNSSGNSSTRMIGELHLTIPSVLEKQNYSSDDWQAYEVETNSAHCSLDLKISDSEDYDSLRSYLDSNRLYDEDYEIDYGIQNKKLNQHPWLMNIVESKISSGVKCIYYAAEKNGKFYLVEFSNYLDKNKVCEFAHDTIVASLKFSN